MITGRLVLVPDSWNGAINYGSHVVGPWKTPKFKFIPKQALRQRQSLARRLERESSGPGWKRDEWLELVAKYGGLCLRCGSDHHIVPDHIKPLARGGEHALTNIQPLCGKCNIWKAMKVIDFRQW